MKPFSLRTERLILNELRPADAQTVAQFCADPIFEQFMSTPWPYELRHAVGFIDEIAPKGWENGTEWSWAMRLEPEGDVLGAVSIRPGLAGMVGYWLGTPHRGHGFMSEATSAVIDAFFERSEQDYAHWECVVGNEASMRIAERLGFTYTGERLGEIPTRNGELTMSWTAQLHRTDSRNPKPGWPL